jgi:hypothetical protein
MMRSVKSSYRGFIGISPTFLLLVLCSAALATGSGETPVGTIVNFGPNLQLAAGGVCRQPEGIAIDYDGNFYLASNSDSATTVGHVCVLDPKGTLIDIIDVASVPGVALIGLVGELWEGDSLLVCDQSDNVVPHGRVLKIDPATTRWTSTPARFSRGPDCT